MAKKSKRFVISVTILFCVFWGCVNREINHLPATDLGNQFTNFYDVCQNAVPPGFYLSRLRLLTGPIPRTCQEKIEALENEIAELESERDQLLSNCRVGERPKSTVWSNALKKQNRSSFVYTWNNGHLFMFPYQKNAYGYGVNSDATGKPFQWKTEAGKNVFGPVKPDAYGLGTGMDQFGRPVKPTPWP